MGVVACVQILYLEILQDYEILCPFDCRADRCGSIQCWLLTFSLCASNQQVFRQSLNTHT